MHRIFYSSLMQQKNKIAILYNMKIQNTFFLIFSVFIPLNADYLFSSTLYHPSLEWRTITTANFHIHYHNGIEKVAKELSVIAEDVHRELLPKIGWKPAAKTHVVLVDNTDSANGYSTPFPVNTVVLYVAKPEPDSVLNNYHEWLKMLFTHEYTHTLNLDTITGFPAVTRSIFGRLWFPSSLQPVWLIEGNAVYHESTGGLGRNNSTYTDMIIRTETLSKTFASVGKAAGFPRNWPRGNVPYLYGGLFLEYLENFHGQRNVAKVFIKNSGNIIPYRINKNAKDVYGRDFNVLWAEWSGYLTSKYLSQAAEITQKGLTNLKVVSNPAHDSLYPRFSRNGKALYYVSDSARTDTSLMRFDFTSEKEKRLCRVYSPLSLSLGIDDTAYTSDTAVYKTFSSYNEAWFYDGRYKRLTKKLRGKYIDISADGKEAVYISQENGLYSLIIDSVGFDSPTAVIKNSDIQMSGTRFSPDGNFILFTIKERTSLTNLVLFDRRANQFTRLTKNSCNNIEGTWHPDGKRILFSSDQSGVYNLHEYDLATQRVKQLTNVISGAFSPDISPDGKKIAFSLYESNGRLIALSEYNDIFYAQYDSAAKKMNADFFAAQEAEKNQAALRSSSYSALSSLFPQFIIPLFHTEKIYPGESDNAVGFMIGSWDVLQRHLYIISASWFFNRQNRLRLDASYTCSVFYPDITIGYYDETIFTGRDDFPYKEDNSAAITRELTRMGYLTFSFPIRTISSTHLISLTGTYEKKDVSFYRPPLIEGEATVDLSKARFMYAYSNTRSYIYSISPERGREILLFYDTYDAKVFSDYTFSRASAQYNEYLPGFSYNHVTALLFRAATYFDKPDVIKPFRLGQSVKGSTQAFSDIRDDWGLRGYAADSAHGTRLAAGSLEYRLPIVQSDYPFGLLPVMFRDLWLAPFIDYGGVWYGSLTKEDLKISAGIQIHTRFTIGYQYDITAFFGYAHGFNTHGEDQFYFGLGTFLGNMFNNSKKRLDYL